MRRRIVYKSDCLKDHLKRSLFIRVMAQVGKPGELIFACAQLCPEKAYTGVYLIYSYS